MNVKLTTEQEAACAMIVDSARNASPCITVGGLAGTGKTTILAEAVRRLAASRITAAVCAPTGKAARVLARRSRAAATTVHSVIYHPTHDVRGALVFVRRDSVPADVILVDEASMVNQSMYDDLLSFGLPVVFVGDHGQLRPIGDDPKIMQKPSVKLEKIHRQAAENPIIRVAHEVRQGQNPVTSIRKHSDGKNVVLLRRDQTVEAISNSDIVIVPYNNIRRAFNSAARRIKKMTSELKVGDVLLCLHNDHRVGVLNGMRGVVRELDIRDKAIRASIDIEDGERRIVNIDREILRLDGPDKHEDLIAKTKNQPKSVASRTTFWAYGYAITAHRAQGSEWDGVSIIEQDIPRDWEPQRWYYTAITRAARRLMWLPL